MPDVEGNGHRPFGDEVTEALQRRIERQQARVDMLENELAQVRPQLKRDERALALLLGQVESKPASKPAGKSRIGERVVKLGPEKVELVRRAILRFAEDHEEFRQVDIRKMPDSGTKDSGLISNAFEILRQDNLIRFVRQDGNNRFYRLTREAVASA